LKVKELKNGIFSIDKPFFLKENWSSMLCECQLCAKEKEEKGISDLITFDDNVDREKLIH